MRRYLIRYVSGGGLPDQYYRDLSRVYHIVTTPEEAMPLDKRAIDALMHVNRSWSPSLWVAYVEDPVT